MLDFQDLGKYKENNRIEAKKAVGGLPHSIWETYSAFANTVGGVILLGVVEQPDKSFQTVALPSPEALLGEFLQKLRDPAVVSANILSPEDVYVTQAQGNPIVVIQVPRAPRRLRPVYIGSDPLSGSYRRNGEGDYRCSPEEVRAMQRDSAEVSLDTGMLEALGPEALRRESTEAFCALAEKNASPQERPPAAEDVLEQAGALARDGSGRLHPTRAGLLLFGSLREIQAEFPLYSLEYQEKPNPDAHWTWRLLSGSGAWSGNLFDFLRAVSRRLPQGLPLEEKAEAALREALVNALVHADYDEPRGLFVVKTPQEILVSNPGGLRLPQEEAVGGGRADPRNAALHRALRMAGLAQGEGGGLRRIYRIWSSLGLQAPRLEEQFAPGRTVLTLPLVPGGGAAHSPAGDPMEQKQALLDYLRDQVSAGEAELAVLLGCGPEHVRALLGELTAQGLVEAHGTKNRRRYELKQNPDREPGGR